MDDQRANREGGAIVDKLRRRLFRFSLKWLLIAVTAVAFWLGWNKYQLHRREQIVTWITQNGMGRISMGEPQFPWKQLPITWRLLGAKPVGEILFQGYSDDGTRAELSAYFPEAVIRYQNN